MILETARSEPSHWPGAYNHLHVSARATMLLRCALDCVFFPTCTSSSLAVYLLARWHFPAYASAALDWMTSGIRLVCAFCSVRAVVGFALLVGGIASCGVWLLAHLCIFAQRLVLHFLPFAFPFPFCPTHFAFSPLGLLCRCSPAPLCFAAFLPVSHPFRLSPQPADSLLPPFLLPLRPSAFVAH